MARIVRRTVSLGALPPLTEDQKAKLAALANMPDETIDYSDIPPLDEKFWTNAVRNPYLDPNHKRTKKAG